MIIPSEASYVHQLLSFIGSSEVFVKLLCESSQSFPEFHNKIIILTLNIELMSFLSYAYLFLIIHDSS